MRRPSLEDYFGTGPEIRYQLCDLGFRLIVFRHDSTIDETVNEHPDIFG